MPTVPSEALSPPMPTVPSEADGPRRGPHSQLAPAEPPRVLPRMAPSLGDHPSDEYRPGAPCTPRLPACICNPAGVEMPPVAELLRKEVVHQPHIPKYAR